MTRAAIAVLLCLACSAALAGDLKLLIPLTGLVDVEEELARLEMKRRALDEALGEFLHEGRRTRDALERHVMDADLVIVGNAVPRQNPEAAATEERQCDDEIEKTNVMIADIKDQMDAIG